MRRVIKRSGARAFEVWFVAKSSRSNDAVLCVMTPSEAEEFAIRLVKLSEDAAKRGEAKRKRLNAATIVERT